ncbi:MAG: acyl-CoA reductase [Microscillaceae bacterium]|jgi:hypothetical protein|nr:acyl-CoA reductase [Microscillaceae bacterium]
MNIEQIILAFVQLNQKINQIDSENLENLLIRAKVENPWFTPENSRLALQGIQRFLSRENFQNWLKNYVVPTPSPRKIGVVMAGNIPLVGFHDALCVLASGHTLLAKLSSQDTVLMKQVLEWLIEIEPQFASRIQFVDKINAADAYIATGSDNSARYFAYYFAKKPHIIRQNRNSCAILTSEESEQDLQALGKDIFQYFGLGCRSVAKLYVPLNYDFRAFFEANEAWHEIVYHHKYGNNYEYNRAVLTMNQTMHYDNGFLLLKNDEKLASPIAVLHYQIYESNADLEQLIATQQTKIQVIASRKAWFPQSIALGSTQMPSLSDYADGVDTMDFLTKL